MFLKKRILALIPARGGSKGIKFKNLKKINGISLIGHTSRFIDQCNFFDETIVSTESKRIKDETMKLKLKTFDRSKSTSKDYTSDYEVIYEVLNDQNIKKKKFDFVVYLQPTSPIRKTSQLINGLKTVIRDNYDASWSVSKIDKKFHPKKILKIKNKNILLSYSSSGKKIFARQQLEDVYIRNGIFYIFRVSKFLKNTNIFLRKNYPSITNYPYVNIDTYQDLKKTREIFQK